MEGQVGLLLDLRGALQAQLPLVDRAARSTLRTIPPNHSSAPPDWLSKTVCPRFVCTTKMSERLEIESSTVVNLLIVEGKDQEFYQSCDLFFTNPHKQTIVLRPFIIVWEWSHLPLF